MEPRRAWAGHAALLELETLRGAPVIAFRSALDDDSVRALYECLRRIGPCERIDLVLSTGGGSVGAARRIALLLREFAGRVTILVPYRATSAGTLLCLSADELALGPMAELSPIDPHVTPAGPPPPDTPEAISAEDVRAFRQMAARWFGVRGRRHRAQLLALLADGVFPLTLSSLYRFDRLSRDAASELLRHQLPRAGERRRRRIAGHLVGGYGAHDHAITRADAQALGLNVVHPTPREEQLIWELAEACRRESVERPGEPGQDGVIGVVMSARFRAREVQRWPEQAAAARRGLEAPAPPDVVWEVEAEVA